MNKDEINKEYWDWVEGEKRISERAYLNFQKQRSKKDVFRHSSLGNTSQKFSVFRTQNSELRAFLTRVIAAAVLVVALGLSIWLSKDKIFDSSPKFTEDQIELAFEHTIKILSHYSQSLNKSFTPLNNIKLEIPNDDQ
ncbi:MAG: hypothetical protein KAH17_00455 [Bacteroidales bacterium]|nr:hypothetical protein [Bacteroidales bacterium]